jgi:hypothetical protein
MPMNDNMHCIHRVTSNPFINSNIMKTGDDWMMNLTNNTETPDEKTTNITDGIHNYNLSSDKTVYTIFFIAVLATWCIYYRSSQRNESESEDEEESAERNVHYTISRSNMDELIIAVNNYASNKIEQRENEQRTKIAKMKPIERQKYFNRLFEKTGNQIVLDQIIVTRNKNTINETEDVDKDI